MTQHFNRIRTIGFCIIAFVIALHLITGELARRCYESIAHIIILLNIPVLFFVALHPKIVAPIATIDIVRYWTTGQNSRGDADLFRITKMYVRYVALAISVHVTTMLRAVIVTPFFERDLVTTVALGAVYWIFIVKKIQEGHLEIYLAKYVVRLSIVIMLFTLGITLVATYLPDTYAVYEAHKMSLCESRGFFL